MSGCALALIRPDGKGSEFWALPFYATTKCDSAIFWEHRRGPVQSPSACPLYNLMPSLILSIGFNLC